MKKTVYLFYLVLVALGLNCAVTDYGTIHDNNQISGKRAGQLGPIINTKGKAHMWCSSQVATIWPDGTDELFSHVDQAADGTGILTTYNNFSTGAEPTFHDDLYCNTDKVGCSIFTAPDNNDNNLFDGVTNSSCSGARSLMLLLSTGRYYGECGRRSKSKISIEDKVRLLNIGQFATRYGLEGLLYTADPSNTTITLTDQTGYAELLPLGGSFTFWRNGGRDNKALLDVTDARLANVLSGYASWLERRDPETTTATLSYHGISTSFRIGQNKEQGIDFQRILERKNSSY